MKVLKNKFVLGFLLFVLLVSIGLGAMVWHYGSIYEKQASVYMRKLEWVLPHSANYSYIYLDDDSSGLYRCGNREKVDYIDTSGAIVKTVSAEEDPAETKLTEDRYTYRENDLIGIKTENGKVVVPAKYAWISTFRNGYAHASKLTGSDVIIDINGNVVKENHYGIRFLCGTKYVIELENHDAEIFDAQTGESWDSYKGRTFNSVWAVDENTFAASFTAEVDDEYVTDYILFDDDMKPVYGDRMFTVLGRESDGMRYFVSSERTFDGKPVEIQCGFLDANGEVAFTFDHVPLCVNDFSEGLTLVYDDQLCAYDHTGKKVFICDYAGPGIEAYQREVSDEYVVYSPYYTQFVDGMAPVTLDGEKWGYINKKGKFVVEPYFKEASLIYEHTAAVCLIRSDAPGTLVNSRWGILNLEEVQ